MRDKLKILAKLFCQKYCFHVVYVLAAESGSHDDMSRLIQLVLGIAINCEHKDSKSYTVYIYIYMYSGYAPVLIGP